MLISPPDQLPGRPSFSLPACAKQEPCRQPSGASIKRKPLFLGWPVNASSFPEMSSLSRLWAPDRFPCGWAATSESPWRWIYSWGRPGRVPRLLGSHTAVCEPPQPGLWLYRSARQPDLCQRRIRRKTVFVDGRGRAPRAPGSLSGNISHCCFFFSF